MVVDVKINGQKSLTPIFDKASNINEFIMIVRQANEIIMSNRKPNMEIEWKVDENGRRSPVTKADIIANNLICSFLKSFSETCFDMPENSLIISEENQEIPFEERNSMEYAAIWVVDPLDGTSSYINYDEEACEFLDDGFTVNIARLEQRRFPNGDGTFTIRWEPIFGIIGCPVSNTVYFGGEGQGSFVVHPDNSIYPIGMDYPKKVKKNFSNIMSRRNVRVAVSASHSNEKTEKLLTNLFGNKIDKTPSGSSMKFIDVFLGKVDFYPRLGRTMEWDICAAVAIGKACGFNIKIYDEDTVLSKNFNDLPSVTFNKEDLSNPYFIVY